MSRSNKLAPEANRILFVKNLAYDIDSAALFDLFGKFGPIRQIRAGTSNTTKGTAYVVYEDVLDAKSALRPLSLTDCAWRFAPPSSALFKQIIFLTAGLLTIRSSMYDPSIPVDPVRRTV